MYGMYISNGGIRRVHNTIIQPSVHLGMAHTKYDVTQYKISDIAQIFFFFTFQYPFLYIWTWTRYVRIYRFRYIFIYILGCQSGMDFSESGK